MEDFKTIDKRIIVRYLNDNGPSSISEVSNNCFNDVNMPDKTLYVGNLMRKMHKDGTITAIRKGLYSANASILGREALQRVRANNPYQKEMFTFQNQKFVPERR